MSYIDTKYLNILSTQLPLFKKKGENLWNFRCPYCGDSQKSRTKARGFVYRKKNDLFFKCHNCGAGATLGNLIKHVNSKVYDDYIMERYRKGVKTNNPEPEFKFNAPVFPKKNIFKNLKSISELPKSHPARGLVEKRNIPQERCADLFLCPDFYGFSNLLVKNKFPPSSCDHPRLLIPFRDENGEVFAYQGRAFGSEQPRYITVKLDENADKIYGLNRVDKTKKILVVEGPIDSMFLDNCIAVAGADFSKKLIDGELVIIYDNEPRNKEICKQIEKTIKQGQKIVIWPNHVKQKDINDMIIAGYTKQDLETIIKNNTFSGAEAQLKLAEWRKINA